MSGRLTWRRLSDVSEPVLWLIGSFLAFDEKCALALTCKRHLSAMRFCAKDLDTVCATQRTTISELCLALCVLDKPLRSLVIAPAHKYWHQSGGLRRLLLRQCRSGLVHLRVVHTTMHAAFTKFRISATSKWLMRALNDGVIATDKLRTLQVSYNYNTGLKCDAPSLRQANLNSGPLIEDSCLETLTVGKRLIYERTGFSRIFRCFPKTFARITRLELTNCFFDDVFLCECLLTTAAHCTALNELHIHFCAFCVSKKKKETKRFAELKKKLKPLAPLRVVHITHASVSQLAVECLSYCAHSTLECLRLKQCTVPTLYSAWKPFFDNCTRLKTLAITEPFDEFRSVLPVEWGRTNIVTAVRRPLASDRTHYCNLREMLRTAICTLDRGSAVHSGIEAEEKYGIEESRIDLVVELPSAECGTKQAITTLLIEKGGVHRYEVTHDSRTECVAIFSSVCKKAMLALCLRPSAEEPTVVCPRGCGLRVPSAAVEMADHLSHVCSHAPVQCPLGCGATYARRVTAAHLQVCAKYEIKCPICFQFVAGGMDAFEAHKGLCESRAQPIFEQLEIAGERKAEVDEGYGAVRVWICAECAQRNFWWRKTCCGVRPKVVRLGDADICRPMRKMLVSGFVPLPKGSYKPTLCGRPRVCL